MRAGRSAAARRVLDQRSPQRPRGHAEQQPPGQPQYQCGRPSRLFLSPSTLHRQSCWKGFQQECTKGPDPLRRSAPPVGQACPEPTAARSAHHRPTAPWPQTWVPWWAFCLGDPIVHGQWVASHAWRSPLWGLIPSASSLPSHHPTLCISGRTPIHLQQPLKDQLPIHGAEFTIGPPLQAGLPQAGFTLREMGDIHGHLCSAGVSLLRIWRRWGRGSRSVGVLMVPVWVGQSPLLLSRRATGQG